MVVKLIRDVRGGETYEGQLFEKRYWSVIEYAALRFKVCIGYYAK